MQNPMANSSQVLRTEQLAPDFFGIHLPEEQAVMLWQGNKTLIVSDKRHEDVESKLFYVVGGNKAFGIVRVDKITPIRASDFKDMMFEHKISEEERVKRFRDKQVLFGYRFSIVTKFVEPALVEQPSESVTNFIGQIKLLSDLIVRDKQLRESISTYNVKIVPTETLRSDFRLFLSYCCSNENSLLYQTLADIVSELHARGDTVFYPERMTEKARTIFDVVYSKLQPFQNNVNFVSERKLFTKPIELVDFMFSM